MASIHCPSLFPFSGLFIFVVLLTEELGPFPNSRTPGGQMTSFGQSNAAEVTAHQFCTEAMSPLPLLMPALRAEAWAHQPEVRETHGTESDFMVIPAEAILDQSTLRRPPDMWLSLVKTRRTPQKLLINMSDAQTPELNKCILCQPLGVQLSVMKNYGSRINQRRN